MIFVFVVSIKGIIDKKKMYIINPNTGRINLAGDSFKKKT